MYDLKRGVKQMEIAEEKIYANSENNKAAVDADINNTNEDNLDFVENKNDVDLVLMKKKI